MTLSSGRETVRQVISLRTVVPAAITASTLGLVEVFGLVAEKFLDRLAQGEVPG